MCKSINDEAECDASQLWCGGMSFGRHDAGVKGRKDLSSFKECENKPWNPRGTLYFVPFPLHELQL